MISICATTYDPSGSLRFGKDRISNPYAANRRGSVTATLDGSSTVYDSGYSISDQTLQATINNVTQAILAQLRYLVAYYSQVIVSCESGCFSTVLSFSINKNSVSLTMRIVTQLDA